MAGSLFLVIVGFVLLVIGGYIVNKTRSGWIGFFAVIILLLGIYLMLVGFGVVPPFST